MNGTEYGQLLVFQEIVKQGSISGASRQLGISTSAVSKALRLLEQRLGTPLFQRNTRTISLTESGEQLYAQTAEIVGSLDTAFENLKNNSKTPSGTVRITLSQVAFTLILQPIYAEFCQQFPDIKLDISINNATVDIIEENFDLGIRFGMSLEDGMIARQLTGEIREGLYCSPSYAQRHGIPQSIDELANHKLIGYRFITANRMYPLTLISDGIAQIITMPEAMICNDSELAIDAIRQGIGIGRIFEPQLPQQPDKSQFLPVLKAHWHNMPPMYLFYPPQKQKAKRVQVVIEFIVERMREIWGKNW